MTKEQQREDLRSLLSIHSEQKQLKPHDLVSSHASRREGLKASAAVVSSASTQWTEEYTLHALQDCPCDEYLGLRWYHVDPSPMMQQFTISKSTPENEPWMMFVDDEFPVHDLVHLEVQAQSHDNNNVTTTKCIPGVITSSNCRDFHTDPKRVARIDHFINKANCSSSGEWCWKRSASSLQLLNGNGDNNKNCSLFSSHHSSIDPRNVLQGKVGNCGFCSGFASIAAGFPDVIKHTFGESSQITMHACGAVSVLLYPQGQPRYLLLDDYLLCKSGKDSEDDSSSGSGRKTKSPSMHSLIENDLWVRLLEKAFVKVQGSLASLDGYYKYNSLYRHPARALQLLIGAPVALEVHYSTIDTELMYDILQRTQGMYARVVHCRKRVDGLIPNHGYSLLWIGEGDGRDRWVCLRNPHGQGSYKGRGFDGCLICKRREQPDAKSLPNCLTVCNITGRIVWKQQEGVDCHPVFCLSDKSDDNGIFFMEFDKFVECFPITTLVGPIEPKRAASSGTTASNHGTDCVHILHRENIQHIHKILEAASFF